MNAKRKGTRNEHRSARLLDGAGYAVTRAAASLGAWDLIGVGPTDVVLCQVKTRDWPGLAETETLRAFPAPANARKLIHRWRDRQRQPDVKVLCGEEMTHATRTPMNDANPHGRRRCTAKSKQAGERCKKAPVTGNDRGRRRVPPPLRLGKTGVSAPRCRHGRRRLPVSRPQK